MGRGGLGITMISSEYFLSMASSSPPLAIFAVTKYHFISECFEIALSIAKLLSKAALKRTISSLCIVPPSQSAVHS